MKFRQSAALCVALFLGASGCSSTEDQSAIPETSDGVAAAVASSEESRGSQEGEASDDRSTTVRSSVVGHAEAIEGPSAAEVTPTLVRLWTSVGASQPLAECYAGMLEDSGLSDGIADLNDLAAAQAKFTPEQAADFGACGTGS